MKKNRLFKYLAAASGYIGIGLVPGYVLSDQVSNTPLWVGGLLILLGATLLGMTISSQNSDSPAPSGSGSTEPVRQEPANGARPEPKPRT